MLKEKQKEILESQGYHIVGEHSAVKTCLWCRKALRNEGTCYKGKFYGIKSWRCVQMSPALNTCNLRCLWCWRAVEFTKPKWKGKAESPKKIVEECIEKQKELLSGFGGFAGTDKKRFSESKTPLHFAVSLIGEPCLYPKLPELLKEIHSRNMSSFLVSNGTVPKMLELLLKKNIQPTQLYITLPAPNKKIFEKSCRPLIKDGWSKIQKSLSLLKKFERSVVRLTLVKGLNMSSPKQYAALIKSASPSFVELKAYMYLGLSRKRLKQKNMPLHSDIVDFAEKLNKYLNYKLIEESRESRVVLLWNEKTPLKIKFD